MTAEQALKHRWFKEQLDEDTIHVRSNHVISAHSRRMVANFSEYLAKKRLRKVALNFIANDLTEAEAEPMLEIFQKITKSEKDVITLAELDAAIDEGMSSSFSFPRFSTRYNVLFGLTILAAIILFHR